MNDSTSRTPIARVLISAVAALCALGLVACGGGDEGEIEDLVKDFAGKVKDKDGAACDLVSFRDAGQGKELAQGFCKGIVEAGGGENIGGKKLSDDPKVEDVKVNGDRATAKVEGEEAKFIKEGGDWKILAEGSGNRGGTGTTPSIPTTPTTPSVPEGIPTSPDQIPTGPTP